MKFEKEATTKNGRRTWKVTYELVRGPEPKKKETPPERSPSSANGKSRASQAAPAAAEKTEAKPAAPGGTKEKKKAASSQLGFF